MIYTYSKTLVHFRCFSLLLDSTIHTPTLKFFSTYTNQRSFMINYLINSCGLSPETAISASKRINFKTPHKPDSVLNFYKNHGFSETQISDLIKKRPNLLLSNFNKTLLPKLDFFYSIGFSPTELANIVSTNPTILTKSLKNQIIPSLNLLKSLLHSDDNLIAAVKRFPRIVEHFRSAVTFSNIEILRQHGLSDSKIVYLLTNQSRSLNLKPDRLKQVVEDVKKMGFDPLQCQFLMAVRALTSMTKSTWKRKMEVYGKWGWSEEDTMLAFRTYPYCMVVSEVKLMAVMDFYVNTMGWESSLIAHRPELMSLSLGKRIVPRCSVFQVLLLKGLIKKPVSPATFLRIRESLFLEKFVTCHEEAPQLLKLYQEKMGLPKVQSSV